MYTFLLCGIVLFIFAWIKFKNKVFYPSVIFCFMWGMNCIFHFLIYEGWVNPLTDISTFDYVYMDTYIIYFTMATIVGFSLAHIFFSNKRIMICFSVDFMNTILSKYKWVMWLNFFGGILRILVMVALVGFSFSNVIDYRLAANEMMMVGQSSFVGLVFRLTAYINMLATLYISLSGLKTGMGYLNMKETLKLFILFAPVQLATGGRLFILYFVIFYFGCFMLGRGISIYSTRKKWLLPEERRVLIKMAMIISPLVVAISLSRGDGGVNNISKYEGTFLDSFTYICDGTMVTDKCMEFFSGGQTLKTANGYQTFVGMTNPAYEFRAYKHNTVFASSVYTIIYPLFLDFGYVGSLIAWMIIAFILEMIALKSLQKMTIIRFIIFAMLLKMCYESILTNPFASNLPFFELILLLAILYKPIFGRFERGTR